MTKGGKVNEGNLKPVAPNSSSLFASLSSSTITSGILQAEYLQSKRTKRSFTTDRRKVQPIVDVPEMYTKFSKKRDENRMPKSVTYTSSNEKDDDKK